MIGFVLRALKNKPTNTTHLATDNGQTMVRDTSGSTAESVRSQAA